MEVELRPVTAGNFYDVVALQVTDEQRKFVAPNVFSLAETWIEPSLMPLAVYAGDELVGFAMYGRDDDTGQWWIVRLMIDQRHQGNGYGRAAASALIRLITERERPPSISLSYEPENTAGAALYRSLGFIETGDIEEGELVARLDLAARSSSAGRRPRRIPQN